MKNKRLPNGLGDLVIDQLLGNMAAQLGGSCVKESGGLMLSIPGDLNPESVRYAPTSQRAWTTRLKWVEKQSAIFLLNAPIVYGVKWKDDGAAKPNNRGLRLSIGLSLSVGTPFPKRYTCFVPHAGNEIRVEHGGCALSLGRGTELILNGLPSWAEADLPMFARGVLMASDHFRARPEVQNAMMKLGEQRRTELTNLDHLYRRRQGSNDRLLGLPTPGTEGSVAIEAELRKLQSIILQRYAVRVRVRFITLGVLEGKIPNEISQAGELARFGKTESV